MALGLAFDSATAVAIVRGCLADCPSDMCGGATPPPQTLEALLASEPLRPTDSAATAQDDQLALAALTSRGWTLLHFAARDGRPRPRGASGRTHAVCRRAQRPHGAPPSHLTRDVAQETHAAPMTPAPSHAAPMTPAPCALPAWPAPAEAIMALRLSKSRSKPACATPLLLPRLTEFLRLGRRASESAYRYR